MQLAPCFKDNTLGEMGDFWDSIGQAFTSIAGQAPSIAQALGPKPIMVLPSTTGYGQGQINPLAFSPYPNAMQNPSLYNPNTALPYGVTPQYPYGTYPPVQSAQSFLTGNTPLILLGGGALLLALLMMGK